MNHKSRRTGMLLTALLAAGALALPAQGAAIPAPTVGDAAVFSKFAFGEDLVIDHDGNATAVWTRSVSHPVILTSSRAAGGQWGSWTAIGRGFAPQLGVDAKGAVTAVWRTPRGGLDTARRQTDGDWTPVVQLTGPGSHVLGFDLEVAARGSAAVAWTHRVGAPGSPRQISWVHRAHLGPWTAPAALTPASTPSARSPTSTWVSCCRQPRSSHA